MASTFNYLSCYLGWVGRSGDFEHERWAGHVFACELHAQHVPAGFSWLHVQRECAVAVLVELAVGNLAVRQMVSNDKFRATRVWEAASVLPDSYKMLGRLKSLIPCDTLVLARVHFLCNVGCTLSAKISQRGFWTTDYISPLGNNNYDVTAAVFIYFFFW